MAGEFRVLLSSLLSPDGATRNRAEVSWVPSREKVTCRALFTYVSNPHQEQFNALNLSVKLPHLISTLKASGDALDVSETCLASKSFHTFLLVCRLGRWPPSSCEEFSSSRPTTWPKFIRRRCARSDPSCWTRSVARKTIRLGGKSVTPWLNWLDTRSVSQTTSSGCDLAAVSRCGGHPRSNY